MLLDVITPKVTIELTVNDEKLSVGHDEYEFITLMIVMVSDADDSWKTYVPASVKVKLNVDIVSELDANVSKYLNWL